MIDFLFDCLQFTCARALSSQEPSLKQDFPSTASKSPERLTAAKCCAKFSSLRTRPAYSPQTSTDSAFTEVWQGQITRVWQLGNCSSPGGGKHPGWRAPACSTPLAARRQGGTDVMGRRAGWQVAAGNGGKQLESQEQAGFPPTAVKGRQRETRQAARWRRGSRALHYWKPGASCLWSWGRRGWGLRWAAHLFHQQGEGRNCNKRRYWVR